ncbi:MAG TPA: PIN domain-containing protein [Smithellaceae bacterium]|nr:PIN domain-containing protein [Smithellaceae bacterium]
MYLLDTNICIFAINKKTPQLINTINKKSKHDIYISSLTIAELEFGVENSQYVEKNRVALLKFISLFRILPFDDEDAVCYGKLKTKLKKKGEIIGPIDMLLAAQALSKDLIFVTNNADEFSRVDGLKIEDWSKELPASV